MNSLIDSLPKKEAASLKTVVKAFDERNFKKALKYLEKIIKTYGLKNEYQILKNLLLISKDLDMPDEEAGVIIKETRKLLMKNLKSGFNWQALGLIYKKRKNYKEAGKSMLQAVRFESDNRVILREAANLLLESRDLLHHRDMRMKLLTKGPNTFSNWLGVALSRDLIEDYQGALNVLDSLMEMMLEEKAAKKNLQKPKKEEEKKVPEKATVLYRKEYSEMILYKAQLLAKAGRAPEATKLMSTEYSKLIVDKSQTNSEIIRILLETENYKALKSVIKKELKRNPNNLNVKLLYLVHYLFVNNGEHLFDQKFKSLLKKGNIYKAILDLVKRNDSKEEALIKMRDYLVLSAGSGNTESLDRLTILLDFQQKDNIEGWMDSLRINIRKNISSVNTAFPRKFKCFISKKWLAELIFNKKGISKVENLKEWEFEPSKEAEEGFNFFDKSLAEVLEKITLKVKEYKGMNPTLALVRILIEEIDALNRSGKWDSNKTTSLSKSNSKLYEKYKKYLSTELNQTNTMHLCFMLGFVLFKLGHIGESIFLFNICLETCPTFEDAYYYRAKAFIQTGFIREGFGDLERFRRLNIQDRCPTSLMFKYLAKFGLFFKCENMMNTFLILGDEIPKMDRIKDLQKMEYLLLMSRGYKSHGLTLRAARFLDFAMNCFVEIKRDQIEFYSFCMRNYNINILKNCLQNADSISKNIRFQKIAGKQLGLLMGISRKLEVSKSNNQEVKFENEIKDFKYKKELGESLKNIGMEYEEVLAFENKDMDEQNNENDNEEMIKKLKKVLTLVFFILKKKKESLLFRLFLQKL